MTLPADRDVNGVELFEVFDREISVEEVADARLAGARQQAAALADPVSRAVSERVTDRINARHTLS